MIGLPTGPPGDLEVCGCDAPMVHTVTSEATGAGVAEMVPLDLSPDAAALAAERFATRAADFLEAAPGPARWSLRCSTCGTLLAFGRIL